MTLYHQVSFWLTVGLTAGLVAALVHRRRYRVCYSFVLYAIAVFVPSFVFAVWPHLYTWDNYFLREVVHNVLKFAVALELAYRTFHAFPTALDRARKVVFLILALVAAMTMSEITSGGTRAAVAVEWHARVLSGTIWLLSGIAALILWYRLPVDPLHKAILIGFVPYLLLFSVGMRAMLEMGQAQSFWFQRAHAIAYLLLLAYWNRAAWAPAPAHDLGPARVRSSQPELA